MADYSRRTASTTLERLPDPLRAAALDRVASSLLAVPTNSPAYLTRNVRLRRPGLLLRATGTGDKDAEHLVAAVIGPDDLLLLSHGEQRGTAVLSARLEDLDVGQLGDLMTEALRQASAQLVGDGIEITGFPVRSDGATGRGSFFFGTGAPDGERAQSALRSAVRAAKA